ncbi:MAG TPA: hypothetical protein VGF75_00735 [Candidatus Saccharimonadales bacterium]
MAGAPVVRDLLQDLAPQAKEFLAKATQKAEPYIRSIGHSLSQTEEGRDVAGLLTSYRQKSDQIFAGLHTKATNDLATKVITKMPESQELLGQARTAARTATFGSHDAALTFLAHQSHQNNGHIATQNMMDNIALYLHEDQKIGTHGHESRFKTNALQVIEKNDPRYKQAKELAKKSEISLDSAMDQLGVQHYNTSSDYRRPDQIEKSATNFISSRFSPLIALPHLGTIFNTVQSTQTSALIKALGETTNLKSLAELKQQHIASGITAEGALRAMRAFEDSRNGAIVKHLPGTLQNVIQKVTSTPGFNYVRDWQMAFTGSATYHSAIDYADKLARDPSNKLARARLEQYGMKPTDFQMIAETGKLTPDQIERAVWNGVNKKIFLDTSMNRSYKSQSNAWTRAFTMYHGYISSQAKFMRDEASIAFKSGDVAQIAKSIAIMGVLFPAAGEALKMLEMVGRGQWSSIHAEAHNDWEELSGQKSESIAGKARDFAGVYLDAYAHLGAFGVGFELIQGIQRGFLIQQMAGPLLGTGAKYLQDFGGLGFRAIEGKKIHPEAAERDALEIGLPYGLGRYAKHALVPTKKEKEAASQSHKLKRLKMGGLKKMTFQ